MATRQQQLNAIMTAESGGQNILSRVPVPAGFTQNQAGSGYYQMIPSTFRQGAAWAGITVPPGAMAMNYDYATQTAAANAIIDRRGLQDWSGPGGRTLSLVNQIDAGQNPRLVTGPVDGGGNLTASNMQTDPNTAITVGPDGIPTMTVRPTPSTGTGTGMVTPQGNPALSGTGAGMPGILPPVLTGGPLSLGITPGLADALQSDVTSTQKTATDIAAGAEAATGTAFRGAFSTFIGGVQNIATRWFIIVAALVLIAVALWRLAEPGASVGSMARRVAKAA